MGPAPGPSGRGNPGSSTVGSPRPQFLSQDKSEAWNPADPCYPLSKAPATLTLFLGSPAHPPAMPDAEGPDHPREVEVLPTGHSLARTLSSKRKWLRNGCRQH